MPTALRWLLRLGPLNPIAVRLVQNGSRRSRHFYIRAGYLAVVILVLLWALVANLGGGELSYRQLAIQSSQSFAFVAYLQICLICILAPVFMAGAIAQEASPRTWEVLLTTPLTPLQIVLGNLLGRLFFILALLLATVPLFGLTQFFGGVPSSAVFFSFFIAATAALVVGTIAIALSVSRLVGKRAVFSFYVAVISYLAITIGVDSFLRTQGAGAVNGNGVTWMTALNPFLALRSVLDPAGYPTLPEGTAGGLRAWFLVSPVAVWCWGSVLFSAGLVLASTVTVRSGGLGTVVGSSEAGIPWYRKALGLGAAGAEFRPPRAVWTNPIAWREAAARNSTLSRMIARYGFIVMGALFGLGLIAAYHTLKLNHTEFRIAMLTTVTGELAVIALVAINMSATAVSREREDGTLDLLLTTPITASDYLWGKLRGLVSYLIPLLLVPVGTLAAAGAYVGLNGLERQGGVSVVSYPTGSSAPMSFPVILPESGLLLPIVVLPFIAFCVMMGLQWSLKSKGTLGSVVATVAVVGVVAGLVGFCGYSALTGIGGIFAGLASLSPGPLLFAATYPEFMGSAQDLSTCRGSLAIGSLIAAIAYIAVVYGVHANMVRTFDMTVRRLAGAR